MSEWGRRVSDLGREAGSQATPSRAPEVPLASSPALEAEEVWLSTVAPSHSSSVEAGTVVGTHTDTAPAPPRKRDALKVERAHFQQQEPSRAEGCTRGQHPAPHPRGCWELCGASHDPLRSHRRLEAAQSQSPWAVLTNEVEMPRAGEWGPRGGMGPAWGSKEAGGGKLRITAGSPGLPKPLKAPLPLRPGAKETIRRNC